MTANVATFLNCITAIHILINMLHQQHHNSNKMYQRKRNKTENINFLKRKLSTCKIRPITMSLEVHQLVIDKGQDTRKPGGLTLTRNTGRAQNR